MHTCSCACVHAHVCVLACVHALMRTRLLDLQGKMTYRDAEYEGEWNHDQKHGRGL
jgi:hypothetical protein